VVALPLRATPGQVPAAASARSGSTSTVAPYQALINEYCLGCHDDDQRTGGLSFGELNVANLAGHTDTWEKVTRKLRGRMMPPAGRKRPDEGAYTGFITYLETSLDALAKTTPNPGRTETFRRLTRTEYHNAVRDLLDLDVDVAQLLARG
jgi:hypothetical protein